MSKGESTVRGINREAKGGRFGWKTVAAGVSAVMMLLAIGAVGCGGGGNSQIFPFAGVWVANGGGGNVLHFSGGVLNFAGAFNFPPSTFLNSGVFTSPQDTLFDKDGNLWVVDGGLNDGAGTGAAVFEFVSAQLASLNSQSAPAPAFIVKALAGATTFNFPQFAAFDGAGNLWISDAVNNVIFKFSAMQLTAATGVGLTPAAVLQGAVRGVFNGTLGIAFDPAGNLWVENNGGTTIVKITTAQLAAANGPTNPITPTTVLTSSVIAGGLPTINNPWGILFDAKGNMWITNEQLSVSACSGSVVEFAAASIAGVGILTPAPAVVITQAAINGTTSQCDPNGITMNKSGNITIANAGNNTLAEFTAAQITTSGALTPHLFLNGAATTLNGPTGLSYGPLTLQ